MKKIINLIIGLSAVFFFASVSMADTATFNASIEIIQSATVTETRALSFPTTTHPGAATVNIPVATSDATAAIFDITSAANTLVNISLDSDTITLNNGGSTILVNNLTIDVAGSGSAPWATPSSARSETTNGTGDLQLLVGATAVVDGTVAVATGSYTGSATITVVNQ